MKTNVFTIVGLFVINSILGQGVQKELKLVCIDSIPFYYLLKMSDSTGKDYLVISFKYSDSKQQRCCQYENVQLGKVYRLTLTKERFMIVNDTLGADLLNAGYLISNYDIGGDQYKLPYKSKNIFRLRYCTCIQKE